MFFAGEVRGTFRLSLFCDCGASGLFVAWPEASVAEVTASPERKSLRFMGPHFWVISETQKDIRSSGELLASSRCHLLNVWKQRISCECTRTNTNKNVRKRQGGRKQS